MMITRFNRLIRNKLLWGIFVILVSIAFVGYYSAAKPGKYKESPANAEGKLFGNEVSRQRFADAMKFELGFREPYDTSDKTYMLIRHQAWRRIAALETAKRMGITVSDEDLLQEIRNDPLFLQNGAFNKYLYTNLVENVFKQPVEVYDQYRREKMILDRLFYNVMDLTWTPSSEMDEKLHGLTDKFTVEYAVINADDYRNKIKLKKKDLQTFFNEHPELFTIPEKKRVKYAKFKINDFIPTVTITEKQALRYYNKNIDNYITARDGKDPVTNSFESAKQSIITNLAWLAATGKAQDAAFDFSMELAPRKYGKQLSIEEAAKNLNTQIATSEYFAVDEIIPGLAVSLEFNETAFELSQARPDLNFSDPITGENAVYVISAMDKMPGRNASFEEAEPRIEEIAGLHTQESDMRKQLSELREEVQKRMLSGETFKKAVKKIDAEFHAPPAFSIYDLSTEKEEDKYMDIVIPAVIQLREGEISDLTPADDDVYILAWVKSRETGDTISSVPVKQRLLAGLTEYRASMTFTDWCDYMLEKGKLEDYNADKE